MWGNSAPSTSVDQQPTGETADPLHQWFTREILPQEQALQRYISRWWRNRDEIEDLRQETFLRVYEFAARSRPVQPKWFLFATARHLMTDLIRRSRVVTIDAVADLDTFSDDRNVNSPEACAVGLEELERLAKALAALPPKCRKVVWLRRVEELPQRQVALQLGVTQKAVEKHVMKGTKLLARAMSKG